MQKRNPAARARIWPPSDLTKANGRLAFVIQPAPIGGLVIQQTLAQEQTS